MTPGLYNFPRQMAGDTFPAFRVTLLNMGLPIDLTGAVIAMQVRRRPGAVDAVLTLTIGDGITITDAAGGIMTIGPFVIPHVQGDHCYDLEVTTAADGVRSYLAGAFPIDMDVTRVPA